MNATPQLIKIGKTIYTATPVKVESDSISRAWKLVATKGSKQEKSLFECARDGGFTLWSNRNGMRGCGLPKLVEAFFMGELQAI